MNQSHDGMTIAAEGLGLGEIPSCWSAPFDELEQRNLKIGSNHCGEDGLSLGVLP